MSKEPAVRRVAPEVALTTTSVTEPARPETEARASGLRWWVLPVAIFALSRVVDTVLLVMAAQQQWPASMTVPSGVPVLVDPPSYFHVVANWDGQWYRSIAEHGYPHVLPRVDGAVVQNSWAFYPFYPFVVALVMLSGLSYGAAGSLVSLVCGTAAMCLLFRMVERTAGRFTAGITVLALCFYAAAPTFQAAYTESMALLLLLGALWCLRERRYGALLAICVVLSLTRPIVLPIALVVGIHWIALWRDRRTTPFPRAQQVKVAAVAVGVAATFAIWPVITGVATGEADAYFLTQRAWILNGAEGWPSWLFQAISLQYPALTFCVFGGLAALAAFVLRGSGRLWGLELRTWALAYPVYILGSARPTTSITRYLMLAAVPWWPLPEVGRDVSSRAVKVGMCVLVVAFGLLCQVIWVEWYFVVGPHAKSYP